MTNYDTEIRRIAEEVRHVLNNCTDAPRLLREYAGLYTQAEVDKEVEAEAAPLREDLETTRIRVTELDGILSEVRALTDT